MDLSRLIKKAGYTNGTLAKEIGVSKSAVDSWTCGKKFPSAKNLINMCKILGYNEGIVLKAIKEIQDFKRG